jgi:hypothetical protein
MYFGFLERDACIGCNFNHHNSHHNDYQVTRKKDQRHRCFGILLHKKKNHIFMIHILLSVNTIHFNFIK